MKQEFIVKKIIPENFIHNLFDATDNGKLTLTVYPPDRENAYDVVYDVDWTKATADELTEKYINLVTTLTKIGQLESELDNINNLKQYLTAEELSVFDTFIRPYEPFEEEEKLNELFLLEDENLSAELKELKRRFLEWRKAQSFKRLPFLHRSPEDFISRAYRYTTLISLDAPEIIVKEEARCLAEEMVLYYYGK